MFKSKIKKGDFVVVISGKSRGATGKISKVLTKNGRCIIEGVALVKRHLKAKNREESSQIVTKESSIHISNVAYCDKKTGMAAKLGYRFESDKKVRFIKSTGEVV